MTISHPVVKDEIKWTTVNGYEFYTRLFLSVVQPPKATVLLLHGFGDRVDYYELMAQLFARSGIQVFGFDQRGFGLSGEKAGDMGNNHGIPTVVKDIAAMNKLAMADGVPHFIYGNSMGGMNALNYCLLHSNDDRIAGVIVQSPALRTFGAILPSASEVKSCEDDDANRLVMKSIEIDPNYYHDNQEMLNLVVAAGINVNDSALGTLVDMHNVGQSIIARAPHFTTPVLLTHGDGDLITDSSATQEFFDNLPGDHDKTLRMLDNCPYHVIHYLVEHGAELQHDYMLWILSRVESACETS
ncbi:hypothetical protein FBU59_002464 [Linderina macrospora]|uniref:Uncharacterized protein n=1 Tax=Linderina macrospora TaxID=4868 RepID=A0ACC1JBF1_9FUNG|nr:hypothetical protein FBU59_002464 [Linderina macrospora]